MGTINRKCDNCGKEYEADTHNLKRGWGLCCSKSCAAKKREKSKEGYDEKRVARNNARRATWNNKSVKDSNLWGDYTGRRTSEGYKIYGETAIDEFGEAVYTVDLNNDTHAFSDDAF